MNTVLLVEDNAVVREPIAAVLRKEGFRVVTASDGQEAIAQAATNRPDVILLDIGLPKVDGIAFLRQIRDDSKLAATPVVILTASSQKETVLQARDLGVRHYLIKSQFSLQHMIARVRQALNEPNRPTAATPGEPDPGPRDRGAAAPRPATGTGEPGIEPGNPENLRSLKPMLSRSELDERIEAASELKALSPTVTQVIKLTNDPNASVERVTKVIKRDHAVAIKILRLANSSAYTRGDPVDSLDRAVVKIGMGAIGQAVLNISVVDNFGSTACDGVIEPFQFWQHEIGCGMIAARLATHLREQDAESAFTMGLIHDVGRLVFVEMLGDRYAEVVRTARDLALPLDQVESRLLLHNHADAMDRILHMWKFPRDLIDPVVFHHLSIGNIRKMAAKRVTEVATLALANRLTHALLLGSSGNECIYPTEEFIESLKIPQPIIEGIFEEVPEETMDVVYSMLSNANSDSAETRDQHWRGQLADSGVAPLFISVHPESDAYGLFLRRLFERTTDQPRLAVMHIRDARQRVPLSSALRAAEQEAEVSNLPLLVLSPAGKYEPEQSLLAKRAHRRLPTPTPVGLMVKAMNDLLAGDAESNATEEGETRAAA